MEGEKGQTLTIHLSAREIAFIQRLLAENGEDPKQWKKAARKFAKEGVYARIKSYIDAFIL